MLLQMFMERRGVLVEALMETGVWQEVLTHRGLLLEVLVNRQQEPILFRLTDIST